MRLLPHLISLVMLVGTNLLISQASTNRISQHADGAFTIIRNGEAYFVTGAGADNPGLYRELAARGGNSVRTWGVSANTINALDSAHAHGLSVLVGLWVQHEAAGFDYNDETRVAQQLENFRSWVRLYKNHPAILGWGIGNEVNIGYSNLKVWDAINDISEMIHEETGGNHLTCTVTAGAGLNMINHIAARAPDLDFLGINLYGGIASAYTNVINSNLNKPYMLTEWGVSGNWEVAKTQWGAPIEPNSTEKASQFRNRYDSHITPHIGTLIGSYAFLWNSKVEASQTWFGLWVRNETTEMIDVLQNKWTGTWPKNRAPKVFIVTLNGNAQSSSEVITRVDSNWVEVFASDLEGDSLTYEFLVQPWPQSENYGLEEIPGATFRTIPHIVAETDSNRARLQFIAADNFRSYRLYVFVRDGNGHVGTASFPFHVEILDSGDDEIAVRAIQDSYVRDGAYENTIQGISDQRNLEVKNSATPGFSREIYLQFPRDSFPANADLFELELFGSAPGEVQTEVYIIPDTEWDESEITWENRPDITGSPAGASLVGQQSMWYSWDITDRLKGVLAESEESITLVVRGIDNYVGDPVRFDSRESGIYVPRVTYAMTTALHNQSMHNGILIYPNPTIGIVNFGGDHTLKPERVLVHDLTGTQVAALPYQERLDLSHLVPGAYLVSLADKNWQILCQEKLLISQSN